MNEIKSTYPPLPAVVPRPVSENEAINSYSVSKPVRVLLYDHTAVWSGGEIALYHLINHLDRTQYEPVVVLSADGPLADRLREAKIETHIFPLRESITKTRKESLGISSLLRLGDLFATLGYTHKLSKFIREQQVGLIHTNSLKSDLIGGFAGRLARIPVIWHVRDRIEKDYLPAKVVSVFRALCRIIPTQVMVNSQATLSTLLPPNTDLQSSSTQSKFSRFHVVHDGTLPRSATSSPTTLASAPPVIGLIGRISPWKGQHIFLEAASQVRKQFPLAKFQIIGAKMFGEDDYEQQVYRLCERLALADCVEFTGFRSDIPDLIDRLTILVHASTMGEPFGQVVIEGMVAGKPVVATNGGGIPEIVQDGTTGLLVPMSDADAMAKAICQLLSNQGKASEMGQLGQKRVQEHFLVSHTARRVEQIYASTLASSRLSKNSVNDL